MLKSICFSNFRVSFVPEASAMSRCFSFPPPGYERKHTINDVNFLKKEKRKEKKHKKDKKDKEKREGKGKREDGKQREQKDKHKDKKKDKDNGKDKENGKNSYLNERRIDRFESQNRDTLLQNDVQIKQKDSFSGYPKSSRNGEHIRSRGQNEKLLVQNRIKTEDIDNSKFVQELGRRIREDEKITRSLQFPVESRKSNVDRCEILKIEEQGITNKSTFDRITIIQNIIDCTPPHLDKKTCEKVKEKTHLTKAERDKKTFIKNSESIGSLNNMSIYNTPTVELKKRKDMETNGLCHENEPRPNKTARPQSSILTENGRKQDYLQNPGLSQVGKSTEQEVNGIIASQPISLVSKKPPIATANHVLVKPPSTRSHSVNTDRVPSQPLPTRPPSSVPNHVTNQALPVSSTKPSILASSKRKESMRPTHPDTKYLKQILTVPELDQWSGLDDQEWLFNSKDYSNFKEKIRDDSLQDNMEVEVWSKAKHLESVDVCALPYVIPY